MADSGSLFLIRFLIRICNVPQGGQLAPPFLEDALPLCRLRRHFPTLWGITLAELSQLDRSRQRRAIVSRP